MQNWSNVKISQYDYFSTKIITKLILFFHLFIIYYSHIVFWNHTAWFLILALVTLGTIGIICVSPITHRIAVRLKCGNAYRILKNVTSFRMLAVMYFGFF